MGLKKYNASIELRINRTCYELKAALNASLIMNLARDVAAAAKAEQELKYDDAAESGKLEDEKLKTHLEEEDNEDDEHAYGGHEAEGRDEEEQEKDVSRALAQEILLSDEIRDQLKQERTLEGLLDQEANHFLQVLRMRNSDGAALVLSMREDNLQLIDVINKAKHRFLDGRRRVQRRSGPSAPRQSADTCSSDGACGRASCSTEAYGSHSCSMLFVILEVDNLVNLFRGPSLSDMIHSICETIEAVTPDSADGKPRKARVMVPYEQEQKARECIHKLAAKKGKKTNIKHWGFRGGFTSPRD